MSTLYDYWPFVGTSSKWDSYNPKYSSLIETETWDDLGVSEPSGESSPDLYGSSEV